MERFSGKVVLVTGAASGIGLASAHAFAAEGAKVVLADRNGALADESAEAIRAKGGLASSIATDVTEFSACEAMVAHAVETFGGLHIAFNNAGIPSSVTPDFEDCSIEEWDQLIKTNLSAMFYAMKAEVPALKASGGTAIVNTASVASFICSPGMASYTSSKHGLAGLTKTASLDLIRHGIRVNAVCPGMVKTPMLQSGGLADPKLQDAMAATIPIERMAQAEEIAAKVLFLASDAASYMVGSMMIADGGVSLS